MLFRSTSVCSAVLYKSSRVTNVSNISPVGAKSSPKLMSLSTRQALITGGDVLPTPSSVSCKLVHSSKE